MKTKLLLAAAVAALSLGATGAQAAPVLAANEVATQSTDTAIEQVRHWYRHNYGYYYYPYYYYRPYYHRYYYYY